MPYKPFLNNQRPFASLYRSPLVVRVKLFPPFLVCIRYCSINICLADPSLHHAIPFPNLLVKLSSVFCFKCLKSPLDKLTPIQRSLSAASLVFICTFATMQMNMPLGIRKREMSHHLQLMLHLLQLQKWCLFASSLTSLYF